MTLSGASCDAVNEDASSTRARLRRRLLLRLALERAQRGALDGGRQVGRDGRAAAPLVDLHERRVSGVRDLAPAVARQATDLVLELGGQGADGGLAGSSHGGAVYSATPAGAHLKAPRRVPPSIRPPARTGPARRPDRASRRRGCRGP